MSLMICPDCGHEVSTAAVACANCGRPTSDPTIERNVVVTEVPPPVRDDFPKWILIPIAAVGFLLLFVLFFWMRNNDDTANTNVNVNIASRRTSDSANSRDSSSRSSNSSSTTSEVPNQVTIPPSDTTTVTSQPPSSSTSSSQPSTVTNVPGQSTTTSGSSSNSTRGVVVVDAKVSTRSGSTQPVRNETFYLLKKDLDQILDEADIKDESGQGLRNTFGLSILYPNRYPEIRRSALDEINKNVVYKATTDASGKAQIGNVEPDSYYLFGIYKTNNGFAIWSSPVTITSGQNVLNLTPASLTEVQ